MWVNGHRLKRNRYAEHYVSSSFVSEDQTTSDITAGEDPVVRAAAIDALGNHNGTVVAIDPNSGRILAMVNQKMALSEGGGAVLDHQGRGGAGGAERKRGHPGNENPAWAAHAHGPDAGAGALQ